MEHWEGGEQRTGFKAMYKVNRLLLLNFMVFGLEGFVRKLTNFTATVGESKC